MCAFDNRGKHKDNPDLVLKSIKNPLQLYNYFKKHITHTTVIDFRESCAVTGGYPFQHDDVLFTSDKYSALKTIVNWDEVTTRTFKYWKDEEFEDLRDRDGGYWELSFNGEGDEQYLGDMGDSYLCSSDDENERINAPDADPEDITEYFLNEMLEGETPFSVLDRDAYEEYLKDVIVDYYVETFPENTTEKFRAHVEKFLSYMPIEKIVKIEIGSSPIEQLAILKEYGASFRSPDLLLSALNAGCLPTCRYLIDNGNSVEHLFEKDSHNRVAFYSEASDIVDGGTDERAKVFYGTAQELGISIDRVDDDGYSPLHHAAESGKEELYHYLVAIGANTTLKNNNGDTPATILSSVNKAIEEERKQHKSVLDYLMTSNLL